MKAFDRFIHAVLLQRPYHLACRWYRSLAAKVRSLRKTLALSVEDPRQKHTDAAIKDLEAFLLSGGTLEFPVCSAPVVSVVIVLYNRAELTLACLRSLQGSAVPLEIIPIDNCSDGPTQALLKKVNGVRYIRNEENLHFLRASNQGAKLANGKYILLLNSDTEVLPGAIEAAMNVLENDPAAGAVGGRLILPDGRLQEAGSFVWADGICEGYGRGGRPDDGAHLFRRHVDFCSGAFLMTPRGLWKELGGFDEAFRPAYYEEADYCLRIWNAGRTVVYEPRATIKHFEFGSSKSSAAPNELMQRNQRLFASRHQDRLVHRPPAHSRNPVFMRTPRGSARTRVLMCDECLPHIRTGAGYPRANRLVGTLVDLGYEVSIYPVTFAEGRETILEVYSDIRPEVEVLAIGPYGQGNIEKLLRERKGFYGTLIISRPATMREFQEIMRRAPELFEGMRIIYDAEAIFTLRELREEKAKGKPVSEEEAERRISKEVSLCDGADAVLAVSEEEAAEFRKRGKQAMVVGHAVPENISEAPFEKRKDFLFVGVIPENRGPNFETVSWFLREAWPELSAALPEARFVIAGRNEATKLTKQPLPERVVSTGVLESLDALYCSARVFVAPTHASAGIPLKVVEAAARGIPVVSSTLLASQLRWNDGAELSVSDDGKEFVRKSLALYNDKALWTAHREAAFAAAQKEYSAGVFKSQLQAAMKAEV